MTGFEPGSSGIGSDRAANCATTTALCGSAITWATGSVTVIVQFEGLKDSTNNR